MRRRGALVLVAVVLGGVLGVVVWTRHSRAADRARSPYVTSAVQRGPIIGKVTATGTLSAIVTVQVGSQVSGTIQKLFVDYNSVVTKGQVIAKIDPRLFEAAVQQAEANYVAAVGNLGKARAQAVDSRRQAERSSELARRKLIAPADRDTAVATADANDAAVAAARGTVAQAGAALHQARINLDYSTIVSPTNGTVISRNVDVGQTVAASLQAPTLFVIAEDLRKMQVDTSVAEADVGRLRDRMKATFTVDAYPGLTFVGTVRQIRNSPQTVQNVVTYDAVIDVANPELKLRPGMTANATFVYAERTAALRVPNAALRFQPPSAATGPRPTPGAAPAPRPPRPEQRALWVLRDGKPQRVPVKLGITDGSFTEVVSGALAPGDLVITDMTGRGGAPGFGGPGMRRMF